VNETQEKKKKTKKKERCTHLKNEQSTHIPGNGSRNLLEDPDGVERKLRRRRIEQVVIHYKELIIVPEHVLYMNVCFFPVV
jgi:hypothetical protein